MAESSAGGGLSLSGGASGALSPSPELLAKGKAKERELVKGLRDFFEQKGVPFDEGWRVEVKIRIAGPTLNTGEPGTRIDTYYFSPAGKRYRSKQEIARDFGLAGEGGGTPGAGSGKGRGKKAGGDGAASGGALPQPLSREVAVAAARKRCEAFQLPHKLSCGVTVTNLGTLHPADHHFCTAEQLWPAGFSAEWEDEKGVRFINTITETPNGPMFRIKAQRLAHEGKPATEIVELGAGPTPDDAYRDAEERQSEALEIALLNRSIKQRGGGGMAYDPDDPDAPVPAGRALDAAEHLLVKCRPLAAQWGTERFGLADPSVLQAIEGLPGSDQVHHYRFVDERPGGWVAAARALNQALAAHGKKQLPVDAKKLASEVAAAAAGAPRKRGPRPSRKEAEENAVRRVVEAMVKHVELEEVKSYTADQKARLKAEKAAERDRKRAEKDKMSEAEKLARLQQKAAYIEQQRQLNATFEDETVANMAEPPPQPSYVATGRLPLHQQAVLLEAWQFMHRFGSQLLGLAPEEPLPSVQQLEAALLGESAPPPTPAPAAEAMVVDGEGGAAAEEGDGAPPPDAAVKLQMSLADFLVSGLFQDTAAAIVGANSDITLADLRGGGRSARHSLAVKPQTWQEVVRRYLTILATSAMTQAKDTGAAGASSPLAIMDPYVILQYLAAGPPASLTQGAAALPRGASKTAGHCTTARADAQAVAAAEELFATATGEASRSEEALALEKQLLRCLLKEIILASKLKRGDGRVLSYGGQAAAAAAKVGRPLDLRSISARIDAGVYSALPHPLQAFASDVRYAASLLQAGCNKTSSLFAQEYSEKQGPELAACAVSKLDASLRELEVANPEEYIRAHALPPRQRRRQSEIPEAPSQAALASAAAGAAASREASVEPSSAVGTEGTEVAGAEGLQQPRLVTDAVRDLNRPFAPFKELGSWQGCVVCWSDDDPARLLPCDTCDCKYHGYCLEPPLEEPPLQTEPFLCPRCQALNPGSFSGGKPFSVEFARASGGETAWRLAQLLASKDYSEWSVEDRCALLRLLITLCAESAQLHDTLHGEEDELREKKKEIASLRQEVKRVQQEMAAQQQAAQQPAQGAAQQQGGAATSPAEGAQGDAQPPAAGPQQGAGPGLPPLPPQRASARRARDLPAEVEAMVTRISKLEQDMNQVGPVRLDPVGLDRHYNRYWLLPAAAVATDPATVHPSAPPLLVIERHAQDSLAPTGATAAAAALGGPAPDVPVGGSAPGWQVGVYNSILQLQQLAQWLCPKGNRERPLADYVTRLLDQHQQFAMAHAQIARGPAPDWQPLEPAAARAAAVQRLQRAMLSFEEGNQPATYDELVGSEERRHRWRQMVLASSTPRSLMSALLVLEGMVRPEFLKTQWRPFAQPAPHPDDTTTLPAVWLRLEALKASVRLKVTLNVRLAKEVMGGSGLAAGGAAGMAGRYSLRDSKPLKRSYYEGPASRKSDGESDGEGSGEDARETRAERAAKRAKQREEDGVADDEALARELDADGARRTRTGRPAYFGERPGGEEEDEDEWRDDGEEEEEESEGEGEEPISGMDE
ncbi:methyl- -binding domain-containing 9 [Chlorella sorokiniana]|uniref:Methyl--binding domain-containing 9 n=1 Tax=Chlorella sorokiniana TaxID=3076 RepID=A0A2P6TD41_CHLSO|nr:methyl- -binding domain-containing 9 [Chlorella sorokiniana]|eukprot:PRW20556.1 methyl- -binding domain-containing 9 [Chlorella sorokiniana]